MGQAMSEYETSRQDLSNKISQISRANCVNACIDSGNNAYINISNSTIHGDLTYTQACFISGASCVLKSSLDSELLNNQSNKQTAQIKDEQDIFNLLNELATIGSSDDITENNYQSLSNEVTQMMNSTCQNSAEVTNNSLVLLLSNDDIEGSLNFGDSGSITNTQCHITNMVKNYIKNDQTNTQSAIISKGSCLAGLGSFIGILFIIIAIRILHGGGKKTVVEQNGDGKKESHKKQRL